jgi:hypothetical protein
LQLDYLQTPNSKGVPKKHTTTASFSSLLFSSFLYSSIVQLSFCFLSLVPVRLIKNQQHQQSQSDSPSHLQNLQHRRQQHQQQQRSSAREKMSVRRTEEGKKQIYTQMGVDFDVGKEGRDIWPQAAMAVTFVPGSTRFQPLFPAQF